MTNTELKVRGLTIDEWIKLETKKQKGSFWGEKYSFKPVCAETQIGDGNQLIYFGTIDQRPYYWLIRIDSKTKIDDIEIETLVDLLEDDFGRVPYHGWIDKDEYEKLKDDHEILDYNSYDDYMDACKYPAVYYSGGHFDLIVNMVTGEVGYSATFVPKNQEV